MKSQPTAKVILDIRYEKKANTFPAKLRVTYQRKQFYLKTKYSFTQKDWEKIDSNRPGDFQEMSDEIKAIERSARDIIKRLPQFSFEAFKKKYLNFNDTTTLDGAFKQYISELREAGQIGTAIGYECTKRSFEKFRPSALLNEVNAEFLKKYEAWMKEQNRSATTISIYVRGLRCILNRAIIDGDFPRELYPFGRRRFNIPQSRNIKRALNESQIADIFNYQCSGATAKAKDFWCLSYLCDGINIQDLCLLKYEYIKGNRIVYERSKTGKIRKILITNEIKELIDKYGQGGNGYIFPVLNEGKTPERRKQLVQLFVHWINDHMKEIGKKLKIDIPVTTYVARHSYASQLLRSGISISAISKKMHDGNIKTTMNYLSDLTDQQEIEMANALTAFKNKPPQAKVVNL